MLPTQIKITKISRSYKDLDTFGIRHIIDLGGKHTAVNSYTSESVPNAEDIDSYIL